MRIQRYVFETLRWPQGFFSVHQHAKRLQQSAAQMHLEVPSMEQIQWALDGIQTEAPMRLKMKWNGDRIETETTPLPAEVMEPIRVQSRIFQRPFASAKYSSPTYASIQKTQPTGVVETLFFSREGMLLEGNIMNVFAVLDGQLCTPPLGAVLPGLMRTWVCENTHVVQRPISKKELQWATEIFGTNSLRGVVSIGAWEHWESQSFVAAEALRKQLRRLK